MDITKKVKKKRLEKKIKKLLFFYIFPFLFLIVFSIWIFNSDFLRVKTLKFVNSDFSYLSKKNIEKEIWKNMDDYYYSILSKRNYLFLPKDELEKKIKTKFPAIKNVVLNLNNDILFVDIQEEIPKFVYCDNQSKEQKCFYMNENGKLFAKYSSIIQNTKEQERFVYFYSSDKKKEGAYYLDKSDDFKKILNLIEKIQLNFGLDIKNVYIENKLFFKLITENGEKLLFDFSLDSEKKLIKMKKIFNKVDDLKINNGTFISDIDYINFFLGDRVVYCLKEDECSGSY